MSNARPIARRRPARRRAAPAALGALLALGALSTGAEAQFVYGYGYARPYPGPVYLDGDLPPVSPRSVVFRLQDRGFTEVARPRFDGTAWIVDATEPAGARVRLFVDARTGGVVGRQRLDAPYYPSNRVARAAPGYGWTEDEATALARNPDHLVPPASIPGPGYARGSGVDRVPPPPRSGPGLDAAPKPAARTLPGAQANAADANPTGVNPDARSETKTRPPAPRRTAKLTSPAKPAAPSATPTAPAMLPAAKVEQTAPAPEAANATTPSDPVPAASHAAADVKPVAETAPAKAWQDPPASEPKRNVRVIGGATVVPGGGTEAPAGAN